MRSGILRDFAQTTDIERVIVSMKDRQDFFENTFCYSLNRKKVVQRRTENILEIRPRSELHAAVAFLFDKARFRVTAAAERKKRYVRVGQSFCSVTEIKWPCFAQNIAHKLR